MDLGVPELLLILLIVFVIFGAGKLPEVGKAVGKSIREFKRCMSGEDEEKVTVHPETLAKTDTTDAKAAS